MKNILYSWGRQTRNKCSCKEEQRGGAAFASTRQNTLSFLGSICEALCHLSMKASRSKQSLFSSCWRLLLSSVVWCEGIPGIFTSSHAEVSRDLTVAVGVPTWLRDPGCKCSNIVKSKCYNKWFYGNYTFYCFTKCTIHRMKLNSYDWWSLKYHLLNNDFLLM